MPLYYLAFLLLLATGIVSAKMLQLAIDGQINASRTWYRIFRVLETVLLAGAALTVVRCFLP